VKNLEQPFSRRRFLAASAASAAAATVAPIGSITRVGAASSAAKTTVNLMYGSGDFTPANKAEFLKLNPDINLRQLEFNQTTLNAMFAAGSPPDIILAHVYDIPAYVLKNQIADITPFLQKSTAIKMNDLAVVNNAYRFDAKSLKLGSGPFYGIAKDWSQDGTMWYNTALFKAAGVAVPSQAKAPNIADLLPLATKLTTRSSGAIQTYGMDLAWTWTHTYRHILHLMDTTGSSFFSADGSTSDWTTKDATAALQFIVEWGKANVGPGPLTVDSSSPAAVFAGGRSAMLMEGYWIQGQLLTSGTNGGSVKNLSNYVLGPAPVLGSHRVSETYFSQGFVMSSASKVKDAAWKLVEYYFGPKSGAERAQIGWGIPALKSVVGGMPHTGPSAEIFHAMQSEQKYFKVMPYTPFASQDAIANVVQGELAKVVQGQETLGSAQSSITRQVNRLLKAGKASLVG
jgi:multiple sugar transport system substrate-binding protein